MRLRLPASALIALAPAALAAQQPTATPPAAPPPAAARAAVPVTGTIPLDRVVAVVGNTIITQSNLRERLVAKTQGGMAVPKDSASLRAASIATLNELVDEELILEKAKELKIEVPDADVNSTVDPSGDSDAFPSGTLFVVSCFAFDPFASITTRTT